VVVAVAVAVAVVEAVSVVVVCHWAQLDMGQAGQAILRP
jgi:hypothetical protein